MIIIQSWITPVKVANRSILIGDHIKVGKEARNIQHYSGRNFQDGLGQNLLSFHRRKKLGLSCSMSYY